MIAGHSVVSHATHPMYKWSSRVQLIKVEIPPKKKTWFRWIRTSGCHLVLSLIISFPEESRTSTEFSLSRWVSSISKNGLHNFSRQFFHLLKNLVISFFLMLNWNFPFCNRCLLHFPSLWVPLKQVQHCLFCSPYQAGVRSLQNLLLSGWTCQAPSGSPYTQHASVPSHPGSPLFAPLSPQSFSPAVSSDPATVNTESQEDCSWKGTFRGRCWSGLCPLLNSSSIHQCSCCCCCCCCCCFWWYQTNKVWETLLQSGKS